MPHRPSSSNLTPSTPVTRLRLGWVALLILGLLAGFLLGFDVDQPGPLLTADQDMGVAAPPRPTANPTRVAAIKATVQARLAALRTPQAPEAATATPASQIALPLIQNQAPATPMPPPPPPAPAAQPGSPDPGPTPDGVLRTARVPILMYHYVSEPPEDADVYRLDLSVPPELFAAQLDRIQAEGYTTISLEQLLRHLVQGAPLPEKPVVITVDDGYRDNYENAFPLLRERGMTAAFFIITDFIDEGRPEYLTWDMVREMHAAGMTIGSHGRNHVSLKDQDTDYLIWQALGSLETIQYELGERPWFVSYPGGEYDQATIDIFKSANYWAGLTTIQGATHRSDDLFQLRRVRVRGTTTPDDLARLLALDW